MKELMMADRQVFTVNGMTCDGCERRITSALDGVPGVEEASVNHEAGTVTLQVDATVAGTHAVRDAIEELGYKVVAG
jgi:Cu2+-exporting ATPase